MVFDTELWRVGCRMYGFGGTYALLYLFHVTLLCFVGFRKVFCHIGHSESREHGEVVIVDRGEQCVFGGKPEHGMEVSNHVCS